MASEAKFVGGDASAHPKSAIVPDATALPAGTILVTTVTGQAKLHATEHESFLGIVEKAKAANDGYTAVSYYDKGRAKFIADGTVTVGDRVCLSPTANKVRTMGSLSIEKFKSFVGTARTTATDGNAVEVEMGV